MAPTNGFFDLEDARQHAAARRNWLEAERKSISDGKVSDEPDLVDQAEQVDGSKAWAVLYSAVRLPLRSIRHLLGRAIGHKLGGHDV